MARIKGIYYMPEKERRRMLNMHSIYDLVLDYIESGANVEQAAAYYTLVRSTADDLDENALKRYAITRAEVNRTDTKTKVILMFLKLSKRQTIEGNRIYENVDRFVGDASRFFTLYRNATRFDFWDIYDSL